MPHVQRRQGGTYISKAKGLIQPTTKGGWELDDDITWSSKEEYVKAVLERTSAWDLANYNSRVNQYGPMPGDLMLRAKQGWFGPFLTPRVTPPLSWEPTCRASARTPSTRT